MSKDNYNPIITGTTVGGVNQVGFKKVSLTNVVKTLADLWGADNLPHGANICFIQIGYNELTNQIAQLNYTLDGTDPDATTGLSLGATETLKLESSSSIENFKCISRTADSLDLNIQFFHTTGNS